MDKHVESGSGDAKESHETTQSDDYVSPATELLANARHLSGRLRTLHNCIQYRLANARLLYLRSELKIAVLYRAQNRICDLETEADDLTHTVCGLLNMQELGYGERDQVTQWRDVIWELGEEIERVLWDMNGDEHRREHDEPGYVNDKGPVDVDGHYDQRSASPLPFADGIHLPNRLNGCRHLACVDDFNNSFPRCTTRYPWTTMGVRCRHIWPVWLVSRLQPHKPRHDLERLPSPVPNSNGGDAPESRDIFENPWYPDGFRLPDAENEEQVECGSGLCDSSHSSKRDTAKVLV